MTHTAQAHMTATTTMVPALTKPSCQVALLLRHRDRQPTTSKLVAMAEAILTPIQADRLVLMMLMALITEEGRLCITNKETTTVGQCTITDQCHQGSSQQIPHDRRGRPLRRGHIPRTDLATAYLLLPITTSEMESAALISPRNIHGRTLIHTDSPVQRKNCLVMRGKEATQDISLTSLRTTVGKTRLSRGAAGNEQLLLLLFS